MYTKLNEFQLKELEYEIDMYPDIVENVLKKMRMKTVLEIYQEDFSRFFRAVQIAKYEKYYKKEDNGLNDNQ